MWWCGTPEPVRALACGSLLGVVFRFVAVCRIAGSSIGGTGGAQSAATAGPGVCAAWCCRVVMIARWAGAGGVVPAHGAGGGGDRGRVPRVAGVAGCLLVRVPALLAAVPGGSGTGRDRLVTG